MIRRSKELEDNVTNFMIKEKLQSCNISGLKGSKRYHEMGTKRDE